MAEADVVRRLKASAGVGTLAVAMPGPDLEGLARGLIEAHRGFRRTEGDFLYVGQVFDHGRYYGLAVIRGEDTHSVAVTLAMITLLGRDGAARKALEDLRAWVAAHV